MTKSTPARAARLRAALKQGPSGEAPDGLYDVIRNERFVRLGKDHALAEARMVSLHEGFHAFLNASTTFGNAMMLAAALAEIEEPGFADWVEHMIGAAVETHETYATVAALCAAARGQIDSTLLAAYPDYHAFLERFVQAFGSERPILAALALTSCARVAMQTPIFEQLLASPCTDWPTLTWPQEQHPDWRFARLLQAEPAAAALSAIDAALNTLGEPLIRLREPILAPLEAMEMLARAPIAAVEALNQASYAAFAHSLVALGAPAPGYDDQRRNLLDVIAIVQAYAGNRLQMTFAVPEDLQEDLTAVMANYRHERLVLREGRDAALFVGANRHSLRLIEPFVGNFEQAAYVHIVAMPKAKAAALYAPEGGWEAVEAFPGEVLTALRRRYLPPDGPPSVQFLLVQLSQLAKIVAHAAPAVPVAVLSSSVIEVPTWADEWAQHGVPLVPRWLVEVDTDPFELIDQLGAFRKTLHMSFVRFRADASSTASLIEVLCIVCEARPNRAFVLPCSAPTREAVAAYAQSQGFAVDFDPGFLQGWRTLLTPAISHLIREEARFGNRFWEGLRRSDSSDSGAA